MRQTKTVNLWINIPKTQIAENIEQKLESEKEDNNEIIMKDSDKGLVKV